MFMAGPYPTNIFRALLLDNPDKLLYKAFEGKSYSSFDSLKVIETYFSMILIKAKRLMIIKYASGR